MSDELPASIRRSTRSTRGSLKPVVDSSAHDDAKKRADAKKAKKVELEPVDCVDLSDEELQNEKPKKVQAKKVSTKKKADVKIDVDEHDEDDDCKEIDDYDPGVEDDVDDDDDDDEDFEVTKPKRASSSKKDKTKVVKKESTVATSKDKPNPSKQTGSESAKKATKTSKQTKVEQELVEVYYDLSEKEMNQINQAFDANCRANTEGLSRVDLKTAIRSLGFETSDDEISAMVDKFSRSKSHVNRDQFHRIMAFKYGSSPGKRDIGLNDEISRVFDLINVDKSGHITIENLQSIAKELNEEFEHGDLIEMIKEADLDGDMKINKQEFYNIMKKTNLY